MQTKGRQKAIESYRITPKQKEYLRTLKMKLKEKNSEKANNHTLEKEPFHYPRTKIPHLATFVVFLY